MIKEIVLVFFLIFICNKDLTAQRKQSVYLELGGAGVFYSLNYDVRIFNRKNGLGIRAGLSGLIDGNRVDRLVPLQINYLIGKKKHQFEVGFGITHYTFKTKERKRYHEFIPTSVLAYRFQGKHLSFRVGLYQAILRGSTKDVIIFMPFWPGISFGYAF